MAHYSASPNAPAVEATFDISATVLTTLTTAAQFAPLPFLQEASFLALAILNTVRGAKDNKEAFKSLANDACELVSAIICVYNDMAKDGQQPSLNLKKRVDDLIILLQRINTFAAKHASKGAMYRMVRLTSQSGKILQYRARLRQALDVFGLQSTISIHETVVQILQELREREPPPQSQNSGSHPSSPSSASASSSPAHPFGNLLQGNISGNIKINHINGNQEFHSTNHYTTVVDSFNHMNSRSNSQGWQGYDD
ncbi:hypothetical protein B0H17DRAFT_1204239 [Mycena rosella]|uniref:Uncharacterized protein n=1 Tax=Mycena rosella TaxID=1033263 RepID=A0AAD7GFM2_MYCRO|nr:hypothetical protein B0H17DRAFT_1204239 [Mycena rosella]